MMSARFAVRRASPITATTSQSCAYAASSIFQWFDPYQDPAGPGPGAVRHAVIDAAADRLRPAQGRSRRRQRQLFQLLLRPPSAILATRCESRPRAGDGDAQLSLAALRHPSSADTYQLPDPVFAGAAARLSAASFLPLLHSA